MKKQTTFRWYILLIICMVLWPFFVHAQDGPRVITEFDTFVVQLHRQLSQENRQADHNRSPIVIRQRVFEQFCGVMRRVWTQDMPAYQHKDTALFYDPKQSVFVHILCNPFGLQSNFDQLWSDQYFLKEERTTLRIYARDENDRDCNPRLSMTSCDVGKVFSDIMHRILNDMFDIKQSAVYGWVVLDSEQDRKQRVDAFVTKHFPGLPLCPDNKCKYPRTYNRLLAYFKRGESLLQNIDILHIDGIIQQYKDNNPDCNMPMQPSYNIFLCGIYTQEHQSMQPFVTMIQNEIFFYQIFMGWYMGRIDSERRLQPEQYLQSNQELARATKIINQTQQQMLWTQETVDMSFRLLREMYATFPIHIWLLIYYEDLYRLRSELVKVVTPLYTLYDKLRNVQDASE